jgi:hypothetical protein
VVAKGITSWCLTVSTNNDSGSGFGKAVNEDSTSMVHGILNIFTNGWQCKEKGCFVRLGHLYVMVLETDVGWEGGRGRQ